MSGKIGKYSVKDANIKHPTRYYSDRQEKSVSNTLNGKQTSNSGATMFQKGDVLSSKFLLECKTKTSHCDSISVKKEWITKNREESIFMNKEHSAVVISFGPDEENYYIIDETLFKILNEYLEQEE